MELTSTAACVLGLLDIGPPPPGRQRWEEDHTMSGAEVWAAIERSVGGFWSMTRSQVYSELKKLTLVQAVAESAQGRYSITAHGQKAVREWFAVFAQAEPRDDQIRSAFTLTVFFGHYLPADTLRRVVAENRLRLERRLDALRTIESSLSGDSSLPGSTLKRAILNLSGAIDWTDDVFDRLDQGGSENVSNNLSNEPPRTGTDDSAHRDIDKAADLHQRGRRRTRRDRRTPGSMGS